MSEESSEFNNFDVNALFHIVLQYSRLLETVPGKPDYIKIEGTELEISKGAVSSLCHEALSLIHI